MSLRPRIPRTPGEHGEWCKGPPFIIGHRGSPLEAPENTLSSLERAVELGLDGFEYDVRACRTQELFLLHDSSLDRTTSLSGLLGDKTMPELYGSDAGAWFDGSFASEPLPTLEEALQVPGLPGAGAPMHMIELKERGLVRELARLLETFGRTLSVRVASFNRETCLEVRDHGLPAMFLALHADEEHRRFVRDERLAAFGVGPGGWSTPAASGEWRCERWGWSIDDPLEMLELTRGGLNAFNTNEPLRAMAVRALVKLCPGDTGPYPLVVSELAMEPPPESSAAALQADWGGSWRVRVEVRNPFAVSVTCELSLAVRRGAFEVEDLEDRFELLPGAQRDLEFSLSGGSWAPGGDPTLACRFLLPDGFSPGAPALVLDAPLHRVRETRLTQESQRLWMLREHPGDQAGSMSLRRRGRDLICSLEHAGGLEDAFVIVRLGSETVRGSQGVRLRLPPDFDHRIGGTAFSCGFEGRMPGSDTVQDVGFAPQRRVRRWSGGLPEGVRHGAPGRLLPG